MSQCCARGQVTLEFSNANPGTVGGSLQSMGRQSCCGRDATETPWIIMPTGQCWSIQDFFICHTEKDLQSLLNCLLMSLPSRTTVSKHDIKVSAPLFHSPHAACLQSWRVGPTSPGMLDTWVGAPAPAHRTHPCSSSIKKMALGNFCVHYQKVNAMTLWCLPTAWYWRNFELAKTYLVWTLNLGPGPATFQH